MQTINPFSLVRALCEYFCLGLLEMLLFPLDGRGRLQVESSCWLLALLLHEILNGHVESQQIMWANGVTKEEWSEKSLITKLKVAEQKDKEVPMMSLSCQNTRDPLTNKQLIVLC